MKIALIATFMSLVVFSSVEGSNDFKTIKGDLDPDQFERATLVIRASVASLSEGSKYHWSDVTRIATLKAPNGFKMPKSFRVAFQSVGEPIPMGVSTLYLVRYNPDKPEYGWKLLQKFDSQKQEFTGGFTFHHNTTTAEQGGTSNRLKPVRWP